MKHFIVYDPASGAVLRSGTCQENDLALQAGPGEAVMEATADSIVVVEVNLAPIRAAVYARIDAAAEVARQQVITAGSGQAMTYLRKEDEARAWLADSSVDTPFLSAEAAATGVTVAALAAQVIANADAWKVIGPRIEAARLGAKKAVRDAADIAAIDAASQVDWTGVLSMEG